LNSQGTKSTRPAYLNQHGTELAGSCKWFFEEASSRRRDVYRQTFVYSTRLILCGGHSGTMGKPKRDDNFPAEPVSLKTLAAYLDLDPTTVSVVLNQLPGRSIPEATRERIRKAALKFNYEPSFLARSLRNGRTMTIGILVPVLANGYHAEVMTGIGDRLLEEKYFYFIAHHRHRTDLIEQYPRMLINRGAEGLIAIDTNLVDKLPFPVVAVAGRRRISGITSIDLDHHRAAELSLRHLYDRGHRTIAVMRGQPYSSDSDARWQGIVEVAQDLGLSLWPN